MAGGTDKLTPRAVQLAPDAPKGPDDFLRYATNLEKRLQQLARQINDALETKQPKA